MTLLDTTSLVHESFLKLTGPRTLALRDRHHFFAYAARVMRSVIVDFARARRAERRGGDAELVTLDTGLANAIAAPDTDVVRISDALDLLAAAEPRLAQVVELRYFGGLSETETPKCWVFERTVRRDWDKARLLMMAAMA
jgi:RNA polymerase sigma factor (TIGR02999 family)